jgi:hypothetical protein
MFWCVSTLAEELDLLVAEDLGGPLAALLLTAIRKQNLQISKQQIIKRENISLAGQVFSFFFSTEFNGKMPLDFLPSVLFTNQLSLGN